MGHPGVTARRIAVLTGKRGGFGAMKPMLRAIDADPGLELQLIVTDQHVSQAFGNTIDEVKRDFKVAAAIDMAQSGGGPAQRAQALGTCLHRMSGALLDLSPDLLVLYGDRGEVLATAIAAIHLGIPIAHLQGGDVSGNVDESMRHAITKLAHLHFPSTAASAQRIRAMGEEAWRIQAVGDNHIDLIVAGEFTPPEMVRQKFGLSPDVAPIVVLQHSETVRLRDNYADMQATLRAVLATGRPTIAVYPCSDHGYEDVVRAIEEQRGHPRLSIFRNIDAPDFWGLLSISALMVGNSSAGLIETPSFRIPSLCLGERQKGRGRAENVLACDYEPDRIALALDKALNDKAFRQRVATCSQPFGDGLAWKRIVDRLKSVELDAKLLEKRLDLESLDGGPS